MFRYFLLTSIMATGQSWILSSTHTNIIPQLTDDVTLKCSNEVPDDASQNIDEMARIRLLKMGNEREWKEYAEIIFPNTSLAKTIGSNEPGLLASGYLGKVSESYLSVTWSSSSEETVGSYKCEIDGFAVDNGNDVHVTTGMVNLTHSNVTSKELLYLVVQLRKKSYQLSKEINSLKEESLVQHQNLKADMINEARNLSQRISQEYISLKEDSLVEHQNLAKNIQRQVHSEIVNNYFELRNWPVGSYSLLSTNDGCPDTFSSKFESGFVQFETETRRRPRHNFTSANNLKEDVFERCGSRNVVKFGVCTIDIKEPRTLWPAGSFCIHYAQPGCPNGFNFGYTTLYPETSRSLIAIDFADAIGISDNLINLHFCCRADGPPETPILLPNTKPFYLYRYKGRCQKVLGSEVKEQTFTIQTDASKSDKFYNEFHPDGTLNDLTIHLCYYYQM